MGKKEKGSGNGKGSNHGGTADPAPTLYGPIAGPSRYYATCASRRVDPEWHHHQPVRPYELGTRLLLLMLHTRSLALTTPTTPSPRLLRSQICL